MDFEGWTKLFGKSQDDPALRAALAAAGVKRVPKLDEDETDVRFDLKGQGLWLLMTDEAYLNDLKDQDIGEGPLILSGVNAYLDKSVSRDVYKGKLPYKISGGMSRVDVRKVMGRPKRSRDETAFDLWVKDEFEIVASYSDDFSLLVGLGVSLPGAE